VPRVPFNLFNLLLVALLTLILSGLQTTFWYQIFGGLPAPLFWLNLVLYLVLYRRRFEGILTIYFVAVLLRSFTAVPLGILWATLLIIFGLVSFVKKRVFWPGSRYFFMASLGTSIAFHLFYYVLSRWLEVNPTTVNFYHRFFEIVFTAISSVPLYWAFSWIDKMSNKETLPESGGAEV
jgi:hypothetical protein